MESIFDKLQAKAYKKQIPAQTKQSRAWFRDEVKGIRVKSADVLGDKNLDRVSHPRAGRMYTYFYDPKHKATLPYYDRYPLIFPVQKADGGFYGINMHYLPHVLRARLMDALYSLSRDRRYDEKTRLKLSYSILNGAAKYKAFRPTFKRYLTNHVRSRFIEISSAEWDIALMMPLQKFAKASAGEVWRDSRKTAK